MEPEGERVWAQKRGQQARSGAMRGGASWTAAVSGMPWGWPVHAQPWREGRAWREKPRVSEQTSRSWAARRWRRQRARGGRSACSAGAPRRGLAPREEPELEWRRSGREVPGCRRGWCPNSGGIAPAAGWGWGSGMVKKMLKARRDVWRGKGGFHGVGPPTPTRRGRTERAPR